MKFKWQLFETKYKVLFVKVKVLHHSIHLQGMFKTCFFGYESNIQIGALSKKCQKCFLFCVFFSIFAPFTLISPVIRQKDKSQNGGNKKSKHPKFPEKRTFTPDTHA